MGIYGWLKAPPAPYLRTESQLAYQKSGTNRGCLYRLQHDPLGFLYLTFLETVGLSLEKIGYVFETPVVCLVKMSLDIQKAKREKPGLEAAKQLNVTKV